MKLFILLKMRKAFIFILLSVYFLSWSNEVASQERINLNRDWRYQENDPSGTDSTLHYSRLKPYLLPCAMILSNRGRNIFVRQETREARWLT